MSANWPHFWRELLKGAAEPVYHFAKNGRDHVLSAANLWVLALERKRLLRNLGMRPGDVLREQPFEFEGLITLVACAVGGYVYWPDSGSWPQNEAEHGGFEDRDAPRLFSARGDGTRDGPLRLGAGSLPREAASLCSRAPVVLLLGSSGSRSRKLVGLTGDGILHQLSTHAAALGLRRGDSRLCLLPQFHAFGLILDLLLGSVARQTIFLDSRGAGSTRTLLEAIEDRDIRHLALVPRMADLLLALASDSGKDGLLRGVTLHAGGAPMGSHFIEAVRSRFGRFVNGYGLTECGPGVLLDGKPVGCDVKLSPAGELLVRTPSLGIFRGDDRVDSEGYFPTGDVARLEAESYRILGRSDDALKTTGGLWLGREEVESFLRQRFSVWCSVSPVAEDGALPVVILGEQSGPDPAAISRFIEERFGLPSRVDFRRASEEVRILVERSRAKSTSDALRAIAHSSTPGDGKRPPGA